MTKVSGPQVRRGCYTQSDSSMLYSYFHLPVPNIYLPIL